MQKIQIGGWPFRLPQKWDEVTPEQAKQLAETGPEDIRKRLTILGKIPGTEHLKSSPEIFLAAYEICSFIEDIPELVSDTIEVAPLHWISNDWTFAEFEAARNIILKHPTELAICMHPLADIKDMTGNYIEAGAKALDGISRFIGQWAEFGIYDEQEPTSEEIFAGVERLQAFGVYPILSKIAEKFGKYPSEIEQQPAGWVMQEYCHNHITDEVIEKIRNLRENRK